jgi:hypothetical protein
VTPELASALTALVVVLVGVLERRLDRHARLKGKRRTRATDRRQNENA